MACQTPFRAAARRHHHRAAGPARLFSPDYDDRRLRRVVAGLLVVPSLNTAAETRRDTNFPDDPDVKLARR